MQRKKILVFSGSGVSKESGIETFRGDSNSLWNNYDINKVADIRAWKEDPKTVINFYNNRRKEMIKARPNKAHQIIAELENWFDVVVITQNIDNLHEIAGSTRVIHLHGEITKLRSESNRRIKKEWINDLELGQLSEDGSQLMPDIVWFGEELDPIVISEANMASADVSACIIIGTSMQVAPANMIPFLTPETCLLYYVDPGDRDFYVPTFREYFFYHFQESATIGMEKVKDDLLSTFKIKV